MLVHRAVPEVVEDCDAETATPTDSSALPEMLCNLPPFPAVASKIIALAGADDPDLREIALAFETDPAFATELLALANSALFGLRARVHSVRSAVPLLGAGRLHSLA